MDVSASRGRFTLRQMLVAVTVFCVLLGLVLMWVRNARESMRQSACKNNLRQLALGVRNHHDGRGDHVPLAMFDGGVSWSAILYPYVEQPGMWRSSLEQRYDAPNNTMRDMLTGVSPPWILNCPTKREWLQLTGGYVAGDFAVPSVGFLNADDPALDDTWLQAHDLDKNFGPFLVNWRKRPQLNRISALRYRSQTSYASWIDGASNQIIFGEKALHPARANTPGKGGDFTIYAWIERDYNASGCTRNGANDLARSPYEPADRAWSRFGSWHHGVTHFAYGDARVEPVNLDASTAVIRDGCHRANHVVFRH